MAVRFSYTLEGFIEAQRFLQQNGLLEKIKQGQKRGLELVEEANKLYHTVSRRAEKNESGK